MSDNLSKYERLIENLKVLENRNPDLKRILTFLDIWLNQFVNSDNAVPSGITCNSSVSCGIEQNSGAVNGTSDGSCVNRGASHGNVSTSDVGRDVGINVAERSSVAGNITGNATGSVTGGTTGHITGSETVTGAQVKSDDGNMSDSANEVEDQATAESEKAVAETLMSHGAATSVGTVSVNRVPGSYAGRITGIDSAGDSVVSASGTDGIEAGDAQNAGVATNTNVWRKEDILQLEKRLLLKIEASRWALERDRMLKNSVNFQAEIEPRDCALLARARELTNCYLWMNNPETAPVIATETYEMLADAYSAAATCVSFMRELIELVDRSPKSEILSRILRDALYITATAQSALRRVTYEVSGREDQDQIRIHRWLTYLTKRYCIYVNRHMKKDSLAPRDRIYIIPEYIKRLQKEVERLGQRQKILTEGFRRIQYHAARISAQNGGDYDWTKIIDTVDELVDAGIPANDSRFDEILKGILATMPEVPSYKEHPFFINVLMELDYWRENEAEKALVKQEMTEMPPQPKVQANGEGAEEYSSVWDEMERSVLPVKPVDENEKSTVGQGTGIMNSGISGSGMPGAGMAGSGMPGMERRSGWGYESQTLPYRDRGDSMNMGAGYRPRVSGMEMESGNRERMDRRSAWGRSVDSVETRQGYYEPTSERRTTFANFSSMKKLQGFGSGILGGREQEREFPVTRSVPETASRSVSSGYSRFAGHRDIPSYAGVVSETAHNLQHHEAEPTPVVEVSPEELLAQIRKSVRDKTIILVDGNSDSEHWNSFLEKLDGMVVFAGEEQIASEMKLAQLIHPGNVAVVMLVEGSVPTANRNVENYCRHFEKPLLRIGRDLDLASFVRQVKAALTLCSLSGN